MKRWILATPVVLSIVAMASHSAEPTDTSTQPASESATSKMVTPQYDEQGALVRPTGYERWVFVGASLGLRYNKDDQHSKTDGPGVFLNVYMQPEAFDEYVRTGYFPDKTMFVMENYKPVEKESIARGGFFEGDLVGMEVAVKDYDRFDLGWGYYSFGSAKGLTEKARAFPKVICWDCHAEHGNDDNVFTQFYPVLLRARAANER